MSHYTLDHLFCFCEPQLIRETENTKNAEFTLYSGNHHQGQGTAMRAIMFEDNYLELIFLESQSDAENNPLRLDKRADWRNTGASPFGICLRGAIPENERHQFWTYNPPYWPEGEIFIHKSNEDKTEQPLIFVIPLSTPPVSKSKLDISYLTHKTGSKKIQAANLAGPNYKWPSISKPQGIVFSEADFPQMKLTVDGFLPNEIFMNDLLTIIGVNSKTPE